MSVEREGAHHAPSGASGELPAIGIAVPSLNQAHYLREALDSIFRQEYPRLEVVVMDGGSTDGSVEVIRSYADRLAHWQSAPDRGQSNAINEGVRRLTTEIVAWLNSDDYYWGDCLWTIGRAYLEHPGAGLYLGNGLRHIEREGTYRIFCPRHVVLNRRALREGPDYLLQPSTFFLRRAWQQVGGLDESLHYCMDWDAILRIAESFSAVSINEILAVSREWEATKTSRGALARCEEIARMVRARSGCEVTAGSLNYFLETLIDLTADSLLSVHPHLRRAMLELRGDLGRVCGVRDGWPEIGDPQDHAYVPLARRAVGGRPPLGDLPSLSVVVPLTDASRSLGAALDSIVDQDYPPLEIVVSDARSSTESLDALRLHADRIILLRCEPGRGPADAIQQGLARATGQVLGWLDCEDLLADGALRHVGRAFVEDPDLDMLYANALYVDDRGRPSLADHGVHRTAFHYGRMPAHEPFPAYWRHEDSVAQPTVFFRARLLEAHGPLDESYRHIFAFELFWRFAASATVRKLERTQALVRVRGDGLVRDSRFLAELYRFSRARWPRFASGALRPVARDFVAHYMQNRFPGARRDLRFWMTASLAGLSALTRIGNPESWRVGHRPDGPRPSSVSLTAPLPAAHLIPPHGARDRPAAGRRYHSLFCSLAVPLGPARDFHVLRRLATLGRVEVFALGAGQDENGRPASGPFDALHTPDRIRREHPEWLDPSRASESLATRAGLEVRRSGLPVIGPRYHLEVTEQLLSLTASLWRALQEALTRERPDFLFVNPQLNPMALFLRTRTLHTRLVLVAHEVEAVRAGRRTGEGGLARLAGGLELRRARRFESRNLALYDGVIAASETDKTAFVERYGFDPRRILVVEDGVDSSAWDANLIPLTAWLEWLKAQPRRGARASGGRRRMRSAKR